MTGRTAEIQETDKRLRDLSSRRAMLSAREWEELYSIVYGVLKAKCMDLVTQMSISPDEAIQDFFEDKLFALSDHNSEINHAGALVVYYRRFLLSLLRDPYIVRRVVPDRDNEENDVPSGGISQNYGVRSASTESINDGLSRQSLIDWIAIELGPLLPDRDSATLPTETRDVVTQFLGVDLAQITREARDFVNGQGRWPHLADHSSWIGLYLRCHLCAEQENAVALSALARKYGIPSYHNRAVKLGVTVPLRRDAALEAFRASYRGQWLNSLGIPIDPDHLTEMSLALKILCLVALKSQEPC